MNVILLSGGSGKRLWPLSHNARPKQFIELFRTENGGQESMVQRIYRQMLKADPQANITVATSEMQAAMLRQQLGEQVNISAEPSRRDTFPAIALACAYLYDVLNIQESEPVLVCPTDPYVREDYFTVLQDLGHVVESSDVSLALMGIEPTCPSEKYGYIIPASSEKISKVIEFKEKPNVDMARQYIDNGALWNGGVFAFQLKYMLEKVQGLLPFTDYQDLLNKYEQLPSISFDYAVSEKEPNAYVMRFSGVWRDIGSWDSLTKVMEKNIVGKGFSYEGCENVHIINELDIPILAVGLHNVIITATPQGILISDKKKSDSVKGLI